MRKSHEKRTKTTKEYDKLFYRDIDMKKSFGCSGRTVNKPHHICFADHVYPPVERDASTQTTPYRCAHCGKEVPQTVSSGVEKERKSKRVGHERSGRYTHYGQSKQIVLAKPHKIQKEKQHQYERYLWEHSGKNFDNWTPGSQMALEQLKNEPVYNASRNSGQQWKRFSTRLPELPSAAGDWSSGSGKRYSYTNAIVKRQPSNSGPIPKNRYDDLSLEGDCEPSRKYRNPRPTYSMLSSVCGDQERQLPPLCASPSMYERSLKKNRKSATFRVVKWPKPAEGQQQQQQQQQQEQQQERSTFISPDCSGYSVSGYDIPKLYDHYGPDSKDLHQHRKSHKHISATKAVHKEPRHDSSQAKAKRPPMDFLQTRDMIDTMVTAPIIERVQRIYETHLAQQMTLIQELNSIPKLVRETIHNGIKNGW